MRHIIVSTAESNLSICNGITASLDVVEDFHKSHAHGDRFAFKSALVGFDKSWPLGANVLKCISLKQLQIVFLWAFFYL